jgi:hypothetical protein
VPAKAKGFRASQSKGFRDSQSEGFSASQRKASESARVGAFASSKASMSSANEVWREERRLDVGCCFEGSGDALGSAVDESEEGGVGFGDVVVVLEGAVRLEEGYRPGGDQEGCGEVGGGVRLGTIYGGGEGVGDGFGEFIADGSGTGFEGFAGVDGGHELVAAGMKEPDVGMLIGDGEVGEEAQGFYGGCAGSSVVDGVAEVVADFGVEVEEEIFFAREVVEDGHAGDVGGVGDLFDSDVIEAALHEETGGDVRDFLAGGEALAGLAVWG